MTLLGWDEVILAFVDEGYQWRLTGPKGVNGPIFGVGLRQDNRGGPAVEAAGAKPLDVLNKLLAECRAKWPPKPPFEDMALESLFEEASKRDWVLHINRAQDQAKGAWFASVVSPHAYRTGYGDNPRQAAVRAMTKLATECYP